jgi:very-short-patch-repair endonuclease/predicted XRE-type DNA-binding protein
VFNGKRPVPSELRDAINYHSVFLDYDASINTRVSYILTDVRSQLQCAGCKITLKIKTSLNAAPTYCSIKCAQANEATKLKRKDTVLEKYGVSNLFQDTELVQQAVMKKYGVTNPSKLNSVREKISKANTENAVSRMKKTKSTVTARYGVDSVGQLDDIKQKKKHTMIQHYGQDHYFKTEEFKEKYKTVMQEKYGVDNPSKNKQVIDKIAKTKIEKYNDPWFNNRNKANTTMLEKYGDHSSRQAWSEETRQLVTDCAQLTEYASGKTVNVMSHELNIAPTTLRRKLYDLNVFNFQQRSNQYEQLIELHLKSKNIHFEKNSRKIIAPYELDFYIPSCNLAIECNGIYWHSELAGKDKFYHLNKTDQCEQQGIRLMHFWDYQIDQNTDLVLSMIDHALRSTTRSIGARKTVVTEITSKCYRSFLNQHHIQQAINSKYKLGLMHGDEIVAVMGIGTSRFKQGELELHRFAIKQGVGVPGAASKLFKYFTNNLKGEYVTLISYADRDISQGNVYRSLGFTKVGISPPAYLYFKDRTVYNRLKFQKHKLSAILDVYDSKLTEWDNMKANNYNRFWNTGTIKYEYKL